MSTITLDANAKINIGLRVVSRRDDGYHDLVTIFQRISLSDKIALKKLKGKIEYSGPALTENIYQNLCVRAAEEFRAKFGNEYGVSITLEKNIPVGAGLGGGSSDAATVIRGLATLYGKNEQKDVLNEIALAVGSDVPFFIGDDSAAMGLGRGEILSPVSGLNRDYYVLILWPGFEISTGRAYITLDDFLTFDQNDIKIIVRTFLDYNGGMPAAEMTNDFEIPVFKEYTRLRAACDTLKTHGALFAGLCGSGSAIFGVFDGGTQARNALEKFEASWKSFICRPC